jgi:hypothetical protein
VGAEQSVDTLISTAELISQGGGDACSRFSPLLATAVVRICDIYALSAESACEGFGVRRIGESEADEVADPATLGVGLIVHRSLGAKDMHFHELNAQYPRSN